MSVCPLDSSATFDILDDTVSLPDDSIADEAKVNLGMPKEVTVV